MDNLKMRLHGKIENAFDSHFVFSKFISKGHGCTLIDESSISYLDTRNNVAHVGHGNPRVVAAVQRQVATLNTNTRYLHPNVTLLAERLCALLPDPLEVVFFVNSGSEANDLALRLARASTGSKNTIVVDGAYHGHTLATLEVSPYKYEHSNEFSSKLEKPSKTANFSSPGRHIWKVPCPDTYRGEFKGDEKAGEKYATYVEEACHFYRNECDEESVGAFIIEGGMSVAGVILPPRDYLRKSVEAVREGGGIYISDEVQTGFGRLGSCFWAFQYQHAHDASNATVIPDIVTVGKCFGAGMPLGAVITTRKIATAFEGMGKTCLRSAVVLAVQPDLSGVFGSLLDVSIF
jgi:ethanolamine-phosphate phospho-lyase